MLVYNKKTIFLPIQKVENFAFEPHLKYHFGGVKGKIIYIKKMLNYFNSIKSSALGHYLNH